MSGKSLIYTQHVVDCCSFFDADGRVNQIWKALIKLHRTVGNCIVFSLRE